jgi:hypothetical protein
MSGYINAINLKVGNKYIFVNKTFRTPIHTDMGTLESIGSSSNDSSVISMHDNEYVFLKFEGKEPKKYSWDDKFEMYTTENSNNGGKKRRRTKRKQRRRKTSRR